MEAKAEEQEKGSPLETIVAVLIALVTVIGAIVVWRASVIEDASGDADFAGLRASINVEETRALDYVNAYEAYGAYTTYKRYSDLGDLIAEDMGQTTEEQADVLNSQRADAHDLALAAEQSFPNKFMNRDGTYALQRQLGEMWADAAKEKDLKPEPQFAEADSLRNKTNRMLGSVSILALALVFFTLVESVSERLKYWMVGFGSALMVVGTVVALLIEFSQFGL
jgi:hypothetical protein